MPQNDPVSQALASAKSTLADANKKFPPASTTPATAPAAKPAAAAPKKAPTTMDELAAKKANVDQYNAATGSSIPKMHKGGPVTHDGPYMLQKGEHVLTAPEAKMAHKHALIMSGLSSMAKGISTSGKPQTAAPAKPVAKSASTKGQPIKMDRVHKKPASKSSTKDIVVRPEKNQAAQVKQQMER